MNYYTLQWGAYPLRIQFVSPAVIGFHGNPATFNEQNLAMLESNGAKVAPGSLFEAQLALRLADGATPTFYDELQAEWAILRAQPLPTE